LVNPDANSVTPAHNAESSVAARSGEDVVPSARASTTGPSNKAGDATAEIEAIRDRLSKLEKEAKPWYSSELFSTVLSGVILALFGFFLTGRLEQAAKERELNIQSAKEMQELLVKISSGSHDEAEAAALSLTTYGRYSIPPLIENLQYGPDRALAAEHGLAALALTDGKDICDELATVLENRTQRYTASCHAGVIRVLGAANCVKAEPALRRYADLIKHADQSGENLTKYQEVVRNATPTNVTQAKEDLKNTFRLLHVDYTF
jgi:hypothetical protein